MHTIPIKRPMRPKPFKLLALLLCVSLLTGCDRITDRAAFTAALYQEARGTTMPGGGLNVRYAELSSNTEVRLGSGTTGPFTRHTCKAARTVRNHQNNSCLRTFDEGQRPICTTRPRSRARCMREATWHA